jgi:hypothetical protein
VGWDEEKRKKKKKRREGERERGPDALYAFI